MTNGEIIGIIAIEFNGLIMSLTSYYNITIHTTFPRLIYIYRTTSILKKRVHVKK
jgi:hypothetical protein